MKRKSFEGMECPIARALEHVGEWWSMLVLRDALNGVTRFDEFQKRTGIAPNMLTKRLNGLVASGLLERRRYCDRTTRYEYVLTDPGRDFRPVLWALLSWSNRHFAPEGGCVVLVDAATGAEADLALYDRVSGRIMEWPNYRATAGVRAGELVKRVYEPGPQGSPAPQDQS